MMEIITDIVKNNEFFSVFNILANSLFYLRFTILNTPDYDMLNNSPA